jgi:hypothetical protein
MDRVMAHSISSTPSDQLRRLVVAGWGVCCGVLIATAITAALIVVRGDTYDHPHPALLSSEYLKHFEDVPWQERYERTWYALSCVLGALGGWVATRYSRIGMSWTLPALIAFVPAAAWICRGVFKGHTNLDRFLATAAILSLPLLRRSSRPLSDLDESPPPVDEAARCRRRMWRTAGLLCMPLAGLLYGVLGPHDVATVASECNSELHVASYIVGPALYYRAPGVVPGLDFESHYGIGHAYSFSFIMGSGGLEKTLQRYVLFVLIVCILYYLSAFLVLTDWLRSVAAALGVTLLLVGVSCEGLSYNLPSCCPVRYPFLFVFLFAAVRGVGHRGNCWCILAGCIAGLSLFWQTDIGLYTLAAGVALYLAAALFLGGGAWRPAVFLASGLGSFAALCLICFGPRVLSITFAERLLEPLLLYATGFGNQLMYWKPGWGYWYNLLGPGLAVASVAVMIGHGRRGSPSPPPRAVLYGAAASLLGLAMLFKWVNRSIDILWSLNGGLVVAVTGWWIWLGWRALSVRLESESRPWLGFARRAAAAAMLVALSIQAARLDSRSATSKYQGGSSSPLVRAVNWVSEFRNPINAARKGISPSRRPLPTDAESTRYLRSHTRRTERVAVICGAEWNYLADAGRAPRLAWLQLFLVHSPVLLDRCANDLRNSDRIFVDRHAVAALKKTNPAAHDCVVRILAEAFELADDSPTRWLLYRRRPGDVAGR